MNTPEPGPTWHFRGDVVVGVKERGRGNILCPLCERASAFRSASAPINVPFPRVKRALYVMPPPPPPCPCCPALALMRAGTNPAALCFVVCTPALQEPAVVCFILLCFYFKNKMHIYRLSTCSQRRGGKGREHEWRCPLQMEATFCECVYDCMAMKSFCFGRKKPTELAKHNNEGCVVHQNTDEPWVGLEQQQKKTYIPPAPGRFFFFCACVSTGYIEGK